MKHGLRFSSIVETLFTDRDLTELAADVAVFWKRTLATEGYFVIIIEVFVIVKIFFRSN